jgi:hypothetical protein
MRKNIVNIAKIPLNFIHYSHVTPKSMLRLMMKETHLSFLKDILTPKEFVTVAFISSAIYNKKYVDGLENQIFSNLFSFYIIDFFNYQTEYECNYCSGDGVNSCPYCGGEGFDTCDVCNGESTVDCSECDGSGEGEDGDSCDFCKGDGHINCEECNGDGGVSCDECGGSGNIECKECDGEGNVKTGDHMPFDIDEYVSYDPKFMEKLIKAENRMKPISYDKLNSYEFIKLRKSSYDHHDKETYKINSKYQNNSYVSFVKKNVEFTKPTNTIRVNNNNWDLESFFD